MKNGKRKIAVDINMERCRILAEKKLSRLNSRECNLWSTVSFCEIFTDMPGGDSDYSPLFNFSLMYRCTNYHQISYMPPILVVMSNLVFLLMMKLEIFGANFCLLDVFFHLIVKYAFIQFYLSLKFHAAWHTMTLGDTCLLRIRTTMSDFPIKRNVLCIVPKYFSEHFYRTLIVSVGAYFISQFRGCIDIPGLSFNVCNSKW